MTLPCNCISAAAVASLRCVLSLVEFSVLLLASETLHWRSIAQSTVPRFHRRALPRSYIYFAVVDSSLASLPVYYLICDTAMILLLLFWSTTTGYSDLAPIRWWQWCADDSAVLAALLLFASLVCLFERCLFPHGLFSLLILHAMIRWPLIIMMRAKVAYF